jgi:hypothetical protein
MFDWIKHLFSPAKQISKLPPLPSPKISVTVSVTSEKRAARFTSPALAQLWTQVRDISHPDHPFLHAVYSPNSQMPAADFTPWVSDRLQANDWNSILELLDFTAFDSQIKAIHRTFKSYDFKRFIEADDRLLHELKAALILAYRIQWMGYPEGRLSLIEEILQHCLALYPFNLREDAFEYLLKGANKLLRKRNRENVGYVQPALSSDNLRSADLYEVSTVGELLRRFPPTFRACIELSIQRGSAVRGTIQPRFHGEYGLRQYGLSEEQNIEFFKQCGFFEPASDLRALAALLKKDQLFEIAATNHIQVTKSWKKDRILDVLLANNNAASAIVAQAGDRFLQLRDNIRGPFDRWRARLVAVQPAALCLACV